MLLGLPEGPGEITPGSALPLESSMDIHGGGQYTPLPRLAKLTWQLISGKVAT
jgi:hypothetical protein